MVFIKQQLLLNQNINNMKKILLFLFVLNIFNINSQCVVDTECAIEPAFPNVCPINLPDGTVGEYYSEDISFYMPNQFSDSETGFEVVLDQVIVTNIVGLPLGLDIELSNPTGIYNPSDSEFGCANLSGTPLVLGDYTITISIQANVTVVGVGISVDQLVNFDIYMTVNEGQGGNASFIYSPSTGCGSVEAEFEALIGSDEYNVSYNWDFGNGFSSNQQFPPNQVYDQAGTYTVTLNTDITSFNYNLNNFIISSTDVDCWGFDLEEACIDIFGAVECWGDPDLLFKLYDGSGNLVYETGYITGETASWNNVDFNMNNPPYSVSIWDTEEWDGTDLSFSGNDNLGTFTLELSDGLHTFNTGCATGNYTISSSLTTIQSFEDTETIIVFDAPTPELNYDEILSILSVPVSNIISYQWYFNGDMIEGANQSTYIALESGTYWVEFITEDGCQSQSLPIDIVKCDNDFTPSIFVSENILLSTDTEYELNWYYNGIYFGSGPNITGSNNGYFWVVASDEFGCEWTSDTIFFQLPNPPNDIDGDGIVNSEDDDVDGDGIVNSEDDDVDGDGILNDYDDDVDGDGINNDDDDSISGYLDLNDLLSDFINLFPNPTDGIFNLQLTNKNSLSGKLFILNIEGKRVFEKDLQLSNNESVLIDISKHKSGMYFVCFSMNDHLIYNQMINIQK